MLADAPFLVSNWQAETRSAVDLMVATFAAITAEPKLSHGEALQKPMLAMIGNVEQPEWADPKFWAHFESPLSSGQASCNGPMPGRAS
jgi:CHAT domain-containing protein